MTNDEKTSMFDPTEELGTAQDVERFVNRDAVEVAVSQGWMANEVASELLVEADGDSAVALRMAFEKGLISSREYDVVAAMSGLRTVAPGYRVTGLLGQGGMGAVYRAIQETLDRPVAIKTILVDADSQTEAMQRFEQEARTVAKLRHPNVITAYDYGNHAGRMYLAMELVDGEDLNTRLEAGPLDETTAWAIARQVAAALSAASKAGVVHRDIKPANILLVPPPDGTSLPPGVPMVKVADFGLSFLQERSNSDRVTSANVAVGSPHYMAPELLSGADATPASDIYALGATVYRCVMGEPPFAGKPLSAIIGDKLSGKVPRIANVSDETVALAARMMSNTPEERPESFQQLIAQIDQLLGTQSSPIEVGATRAAATSSNGQCEPFESNRAKIVMMAIAVVVTATVVTMIAPPKRPPAVENPSAETSASTSRDLATDAMEKVESGASYSLFNPDDIEGWKSDDARTQWGLKENSEGLQSIEVKSGAIYRSVQPLTQSGGTDGGEVDHFRIQALAERSPGDTVGFRFNLTGDGPYYEVVVSDDEASVFRHSAANSASPAIDAIALSSPASAADGPIRSLVHIDFCATEWSVTVNDRKLKTVPVFDLPEPRFGFAALDGPATFSDLRFVELIPKPDPAVETASSQAASAEANGG